MVRKSSKKGAPIIAVQEELAVATADTVVNSTLFAPPLGTTSSLQTWRFHLGSIQCEVTDGATGHRLYAVVRRVPAGYSAPSITVSTGVTTFADIANVMAYGIYTTTDVREEVQWRWLRRNVIVQPGDTIITQYAIDISSAGSAVSTLVEYNITAL